MKRFLTLICALAAFASVAAQDFSRHDARFGESHTYEAADDERVMRTWYNYVVSKKGTKYVVRTFFPETGALVSYHTYFDAGLTVLDGPYALYSDDGAAATQGTYARGTLVGPWSTSADGQPLEAGVYDDGLRVDEWRQHYPNGQLKSCFTYVGGEELGPYALYDTAGVVLDTGNSMFGERYTSLPPAEFEERRGRAVIDEFPCFGACDAGGSLSEQTAASGQAVSNYIREHLRYPEEVRPYGVAGRVNASVTIDRTGKVVGVEVVNGLCAPIAAEVRRLLLAMPDWRPGTKNGEPADVSVLIPFSFSPT